MKKISLLVLGFAVFFLALGFGWTWYRDNRVSNFERTAEIYVRPGDSASEVLRQSAQRQPPRTAGVWSVVSATKKSLRTSSQGIIR